MSKQWWLVRLILFFFLLTFYHASSLIQHETSNNSKSMCYLDHIRQTHLKIELHPLELFLDDSESFSDVKIINRPGPSKYACARLGDNLIGLQFQKDEWQVKWKKQVFSNNWLGSSAKNYPWSLTDSFLSKQDMIVIKNDRALNYYKPNEDFSNLLEVYDRENIFDDAFGWQLDSSKLLIGHFYPEENYLGVFAKKDGVINFYVISESYPKGDTMQELKTTQQDSFWQDEDTMFSLQTLNSSQIQKSFVLLKGNELRIYEFDANYNIQLILKSPILLNSNNGKASIFFANFTHQPLKDLLVLNDLGLFIYKYDVISNNYSLFDVNTMFSSDKGWLPRHTETVQVISTDTDDKLIFNGPNGIQILLIDPKKGALIQDTLISDESKYLRLFATTDSFMFFQSWSGERYWGRILDHAVESRNTSDVICSDDVPTLTRLLVSNDISYTQKSPPILKNYDMWTARKPTLRWAEKWQENYARTAVNGFEGSLEFSLPLVEIFLAPNFNLSLSATYDSARGRSNLLGKGWSINIMQDFITVNYKTSIFPINYQYFISHDGYMDMLEIDSRNSGIIYFKFKNSTRSVKFSERDNTWTMTDGHIIKEYGKCGGNDAIQWSLGWKNWRGAGSEINGLEPLPVAWHLCKQEDLKSKNVLTYQYEKGWKSVGRKKYVSNMQLKHISHNKFKVTLEYQSKESSLHQTANPLDEFSGLYTFPTPLEEPYLLKGIETDHDLYEQTLGMAFKKLGQSHVFTSFTQKTKSGAKESLFEAEYQKIGEKSVVLTKFTSQNGLVMDFGYELIKDPVLTAGKVAFPLPEGMQISVGDNYVVKSYGYKKNEITVHFMDMTATKVNQYLKIKIPPRMKTFEIRAIAGLVFCLIHKDNGIEITTIHRSKNIWSVSNQVLYLNVDVALGIFQNLIVHCELENGMTYFEEWNTENESWRKTSIRTSPLKKVNIEENLVIGFSRSDELVTIYKSDGTPRWKGKSTKIHNWDFTDCAIFDKFTIPKTDTAGLCSVFKRNFFVRKNVIFMTRVYESAEGRLTLEGLFLSLNSNYDIERRETIQIFTTNIWTLSKTVSNDGRNFLLQYRKHLNQYALSVTDISGKDINGATSKQKQEAIKEVDENFRREQKSANLVPWQNYTTGFSSHGLHLPDGTVYRMAGDKWLRANFKMSDTIPLGKTFFLESTDNKQFKLKKKLPYGHSRVDFSFGTLPGEILIQYPEYLAYHSSNHTTKVLLFQDADTLGSELTFYGEQLLFLQGSGSLVTSTIETKTKELIVRPISSLKLPLSRPVVNYQSSSSSSSRRQTAFERSTHVSIDQKVVTRTVALIPNANKKHAGWTEHKVTFDVVEFNTTESFKVFDNTENEVPAPRKNEKVQATDDGSKEEFLDVMLWDVTGELEIGNFHPFSLQADECDYIGFENYETKRKWVFSPDAVVQDGFSFTGKNFLMLSHGVLQRKLTPATQEGIYLATTWLRTSDVLPLEASTSLFTAEISIPSKKIILLKMLAVAKRRQGEWTYYEIFIDFESIRKAYLAYGQKRGLEIEDPEDVDFQITLSIQANDTSVDVDHVTFSSLTHQLAANVYGSDSNLKTATIHSNGLVTRDVYNRFGNRIVAVNDNGLIAECMSASYSGRLLVNTYKKPLLASRILIKPELGMLESFDKLAFTSRWSLDSPNRWQVTPFHLWHSHVGVDKMEPSQELKQLIGSATSLGLRLDYHLIKPGSEVRFLNEMLVLNSISDPATIQFCDQKADLIPTSAELVIFVSKKRIVVFIDGISVLDKVNTCKTSIVDASIYASNAVGIENLAVMKNPAIDIHYLNEWGQVRQNVKLIDSNTVLVMEILYDELGREAITTKSTKISPDNTQPLLAFYDDFITDYDTVWKTGKLNGRVDQLNQEDDGYPYTRTTFYPNPYGKMHLELHPGAEFSVDGVFRKEHKQNSSIAFLENRFPSKDGFRQESVSEPNMSIMVKIFDVNNNKVAEYIRTPGFDHALTTYEYDDKNRLVKILPPSYHEKSTLSAQPQPWSKGEKHLTEEERNLQAEYGTFFSFDSEGNLIKRTTPDAGTTEFLYNNDGNLRFMYTTNTTNFTESLNYYKYDAFGQMIESGEGTLPLQREYLSFLIDQENIPGEQTFQKFQYQDTHENPDLRGRYHIIQTETTGGSVYDSIVFNGDRNVIVKKTIPLTVDSDLGVFTELKKEFIGNKLRTLEYPITYLGKPLVLLHKYNYGGQLIELGLPGASNYFSNFEYNGDGQLTKEKINANGRFSRNYQYNSPGYLTHIADKFLEQTLTYTSGGYGQGGFGDGMVMSLKNKANWHEQSNPENFSIDKKDIESLCLKYLTEKGYLEPSGRVTKPFFAEQVLDLPILCSGSVSYRLSKITSEKQPAKNYGYSFSYGNHKELRKAKYFSDPDENCSTPLQPSSFLQSGLTLAQSKKVFKVLVENRFLVSDAARYDDSFAFGNARRSIINMAGIKRAFANLSSAAHIYHQPLEKLLTVLASQNLTIARDDFLNFFNAWDEDYEGNSNTKMGILIYDALMMAEILPTDGDPYCSLDSDFRQILKNYSNVMPQIVKVLHQHFSKVLGSSPFDLMSYEIDPNGNHKQFKVGFDHYTMRYYKASNKIEFVTRRSIFSGNAEEHFKMVHDKKGNVIQALHKNIIDISYDPVSQRTNAITLNDGRRIFFSYDAKGERVLKKVVDTTGITLTEKHYLRDESGQVYMDRVIKFNRDPIAPDTITTAYIYGTRGLLGFIRDDEFYSVTTDHQGSTKLVIKDGRVITAYEYMPYGELAKSYSPDPTAHVMYRYTGQEYDEETNLYNYHARLYDPSIGRFYQPDPLAQYASPYKYAGNSPVSLVDPTGEFAFLLSLFIGLAIGGAYLGGAAANKTWNVTKWKFDTKTVLGVLGGALIGAFMPIGFAGSVALLGTLGLGTTAAAITTTALGIGGLYLSAAARQGWNPAQWKWKDPEIWYAMFDGFAAGSGLLGNFYDRNPSKYYKIFTGSKIGVGAVMGYVSASEANGGNYRFWDWNYSDAKTLSSILTGFDAGAGLPELGVWLAKAAKSGLSVAKNHKALKNSFKNLSPAQVIKMSKTLKNVRSPVYKVALAGVMGYISGSQANENFTNWDWASYGTYQGLFNGMYMGKNLIQPKSLDTSKDKNYGKGERKKVAKNVKRNAEENQKIARSLSTQLVTKMKEVAQISKGINPRIIFPVFFSALKDRYSHFRGNRPGQSESNHLNKRLLKDAIELNKDLGKQNREAPMYLEKEVDYMTCKSKRSKRSGHGSGVLCGLPVILPRKESADTFLKKQNSGKSVEALLAKTPVKHSSADIRFFPEYFLGGTLTYLQSKKNTMVSKAFLATHSEGKSYEQTLVLFSKKAEGNSQTEVTIKKFITKEADSAKTNQVHPDWAKKSLVDKEWLTKKLGYSSRDKMNEEVLIKAELIEISKNNENNNSGKLIHKNYGSENIRFADLDDNVEEAYNVVYDDSTRKVSSLGDLKDNVHRWTSLVANGDQVGEAHRIAAHNILDNILYAYHDRVDAVSVGKDYHKLEAEFHGFLYGALEMNTKKTYGTDVLVEQVAGRGELDAAVFFRETTESGEVVNMPPIIIELKGDKAVSESSSNTPDNFKKFKDIRYEDNPTDEKTTVRYTTPLDGSAIDQISRKGYDWNLPTKSTETKYIALAVSSLGKDANGNYVRNIRSEVRDIPKYEGLVDFLMSKDVKNIANDGNIRAGICEQIIKQHYSWSPYALKKGGRSYTVPLVIGEVIGRSRESYILKTQSQSPERTVLFKTESDQWVLLKIVDGGRKANRKRVTLPPDIESKKITQITIEMPPKFIEMDNRITMSYKDSIQLNNYVKGKQDHSFSKLNKVSMDEFKASAPFSSPLDNFFENIEKNSKSYTDSGLIRSESDLQAHVQGIVIGNQPVFNRDGQILKCYPESSLASKGRMDLLISLSDPNAHRDSLYMLELKKEKKETGKDAKKKLQSPMKQIEGYFAREHLTAVTNAREVEGRAVIVTERGKIILGDQQIHQLREEPSFSESGSDMEVDVFMPPPPPPPPSKKRPRGERSIRDPQHFETGEPTNTTSLFTFKESLPLSMDTHASSSASRLEFWPLSAVNAIFRSIQAMWNLNVHSKRDLNKITENSKRFHFTSNNKHFTLLEMGDQWLADTSFQGNMLWLFVLIKKFTNLEVQMPKSYDREFSTELDIMANSLTHEFAEVVANKALACGIPTVVRKLLHDAEFSNISREVYQKLFNGQIDEAGEILVRELLFKNLSKITKMSSAKQSNQLKTLVVSHFFK